MKKQIFLIFIILLIVQIAFAGVTNPLPSELNLLKGESGRFKFQIQAVTSENDLVCIVSPESEAFFNVDFDKTEIEVAAGTIEEVYGTVNVPGNLEFGSYEASFCISCSPAGGASGTAVSIDTCGLPINVNVVEQRTKENMNIPSKTIPLLLIIAIFAVIAVFVLLFYMLWKKSKSISVKKPGKAKPKIQKKKKNKDA